MNNKIYLSLVIASLFAGCSSSDIQDYIEDKIKNDDGLVSDTGGITEGEENNISISTQIQDALDAHNSARNSVGVSNNLVWDETIANDAQSYADALAISGAWEHDPKNQKTDGTGYENGIYGENLYTSTAKVTLEYAVNEWAAEEAYYHYEDNSCDANQLCGHYTQIVWKDTSRVGCAMSKYKTGTYKNWYLVVCKYQTPGNYIGQKPY